MRILRTKLFLALAVMIGVTWSLPKTSWANSPGFNWNNLISDDEFTDAFSLSPSGIQEFLNTQPGILKSYVASDGRTAAQIIAQAAQANAISPKVILTSIQKESSLITRTNFNTSGYSGSQQYYLDWALFYGWCDSCSTGTDKGFSNQVSAAAAAFRRYINYIAQYGYSVSGWGPGIAKNVQCIQSDFDNGRELCAPGSLITVTPINAATSALYTYTPHPGGNYAFWYLWTNFGFGNRRIYPSGSLLRAQGSPNIWLVQGTQKRRFANSAAFLSRYTFNRVITVPADHLYAYSTGLDISFANYSLLKSPQGGVYLLADDTKRPIISRQAFQNAGFRWEEVVAASWDQINQIPDGEKITPDNIYPSGVLMQNKTSGAVFYVKDNVSHPIVCREIMRSQFGRRRPVPTAASTLSAYPQGAPVGFKDGDLITAGATAYVISQGQKLPIASPAAFNAFRFQWANLQRVSPTCLAVHPDGPLLDVDTVLHTASVSP